MSLRERHDKWHFRFQFQGKEHSGSTGLEATAQNKRKANKAESDFLTELIEGRRSRLEIEVLAFEEADKKFLLHAEASYRAHPNSNKRIKTSLASARVFFAKTPVSMIDGAKVDAYKSWRVNEHKVRDITLRHDLHALSAFFKHAIRHHWAFSNPIAELDIPSGADAVRMHVLTAAEEESYFKFADRFQICVTSVV
jgi:hypothetical protein